MYILPDEKTESRNFHDLVLDRMRSEHGVLGNCLDTREPGLGHGKAAALLHAQVVEGQPVAEPGPRRD